MRKQPPIWCYGAKVLCLNSFLPYRVFFSQAEYTTDPVALPLAVHCHAHAAPDISYVQSNQENRLPFQHLMQNLSCSARGGFDPNECRQGRCNVNGMDSALNVLGRDLHAAEGDGYEGIVAPG